MARRFVTSEDVRRARGGEIVVDGDTLVTPQALEVARAEGVVIRSAAGDYRPPAPDRGPDAERATASLPHLPEPVDDGGGVGVVITVVGRNRPGVLAEVTRALADRGVNVDNISQRMIDAYFHLVLTVTTPPELAFDELKQTMECLGGGDDFVVRVMHERVFRFMHRI